ncbi:MAG: LamG domain-containing protein [Planctomycetes bacterium]|nr:LamG domain-containing protein [Planctomycetota bacterium]
MPPHSLARPLAPSLSFGIAAVMALPTAAASQVAAHPVPLDPTATFLRTDPIDTPAAPIVIDLAALGYVPGQLVRLRTAGDFLFHPPGPVQGENAVAVFSDGATVLPPSQPHRVPGAIASGAPNYVTAPTNNQGLVTDIAEDFGVDRQGVTVQIPVIPSGVPLLLVGADDVFWGDNVDPENDFVVIVENPLARHALRFDGVDDWTLATGVPPARSFEAIARIVRPAAAGWGDLWSQHLANGVCDHGGAVSFDGNRRVAFNLDIPGCSNSNVAYSPPLGASWVHIAATYDGQTQRVYVDGVEHGTKTNLSPTWRSGLSLGGTTDRVWLGTRFEIAELRLWNHARSPAEVVAHLAEDSIAPNAPGLIALYRFDEGTGQLAYDSSPNGYTMRLGTTSGPDAADPVWIDAFGAAEFGSGCAGSGACIPSIATSGSVNCLAGSFGIDLGNGLGGSAAFLAFGLAEAPNAPLPFYLDPPANTCAVLVSPVASVFAPVVGNGACAGVASYSVVVPQGCPPGFDLSAQWAVLDTAAPGLGIALSPALAIRL